MGQVESLLLGNEMLKVQDWLPRSKGAEEMMKEGGKIEKDPGGTQRQRREAEDRTRMKRT